MLLPYNSTPVMNYFYFIFPAVILFFGCSNATQQHHSETTTLPAATQDSVPQPPQGTLPDSATVFLQQHFAPDALQHVTEKRSLTPDGTFYEAKLMDGTEINFGKAGNWIEVNTEEPNQLPTSFFPEPIRAYLESNFSGIGVESIDKDGAGYELELTNDVYLHFDTEGSFVRQEK